MSANTSATGGYLAPQSDPAEDDALDAQLQTLTVGITGLPGKMVRPRWQAVPPKQPEPTEDWCAIGVMDITPDDNAVLIQDGNVEKTQRHEEIRVLASFYGPHSATYAARLRDGFWVAQNREALLFQSMALVNVSPVLNTADLVNQRWIRRRDVTVTLRRLVIRAYPVLSVLSAPTVTHSGGPPEDT